MIVVHQAHHLFAFREINADETRGMKADDKIMQLRLGKAVKDGV